MAGDSGVDYMMVDFEKGPVNGLLATTEDLIPNPPTPTCGDSMPEPKSPFLNGFSGIRRGSSQESSIIKNAKLKNLQLSSRNLSLGPEQFIVASPKKSQTSENGFYDDLVVPEPNRNHALPVANLPTGLCYDMRMRYHCEMEPPTDRLEIHPEDPRRIYQIYKELCLAGLVDDPISRVPIVPKPLHRIYAREATQAEICLVHDLKHFIAVAQTKEMNEDDLLIVQEQHDSIYFNKYTYNCALLSAGGAIDTCRAVAGRQLKNAIAVIRPPGHHAECNRPMGFCIFDNVSISAKACMNEFPDTCKKVLILDWDVHHGNGIQQAFYQDPNVLYISLHVHEDGRFYPQGPYGDHLHCGAGAGLGKNINIPWPTKGMGDADYLFAFQHVVLPVALSFDPDLIIIAAGFDAAAGDQLGGCFLSPTCYAHMTAMLMPLANGKIVACLEGGYNLESISKSALAVTRTLMGEPPGRLKNVTASSSAIATVKKVAAFQSKYWPCIILKDIDQELIYSDGPERMHDIVRRFQSSELFETHKMTDLWINREKISRSFEKQVLSTPNYAGASPLIVIFHDPPEMVGKPDPFTFKMDLHNTWLADGLRFYIDWAVEQGFGIIDVNIPKHHTGLEGSNSSENWRSRITLMNELAAYLWDNYIECNEASEIFFVGVGSAYQAITNLLSYRGQRISPTVPTINLKAATHLSIAVENVWQRVTGIILFVFDEYLHPVSESTVFNLARWYKQHSYVLASLAHPIWVQTPPGKNPSKRFGSVIASPAKSLHDMLIKHQEDVQSFILGRLNESRSGEGGSRRMSLASS